VLVSREVCCGGVTKGWNAQVQSGENSPLNAEKLVIGTGTALTDEEATKYRSIVGGLQYLTLTRPDISFGTNSFMLP
jgi:hypothetical protein